MSSDQPRRGIIPRAEDSPLDDDPTRATPVPQRGTPTFGDEPPAPIPTSPQRAALEDPFPPTPPATPSYVPTFFERSTAQTPMYEPLPPLEPTPAPFSPTPLYRSAPPPEPIADPTLDDAPTQTLPRHSSDPLPDEPETPHTFSNALGWTILGTLLPGVGLVRGGSRASGIAALVIFLASLGGLGYLAYEGHLAARLITNPIALIIGATLCGVLAILMTGLVVATYVALRPRTITVLQRIVGAIVVGVLCFVVSAPFAVVATAGYAQAKLVTLLFRTTESQTRPTITPGPASDLWANTPRINVLLVGGDAGGTTDTVIVASIDTKTGSTVLVTVPRDLARLPFPTSSPLRTYFPNGYWDGSSGESPASWVNRLWTDLPKKVPGNALGTTSNLSADALKQGIGEALGLRVDYYLYASVADLYTLVDALGGVTVNLATRVPTDATATSWIEPGAGHHLDAYQAVWYGWSSAGTDAERQTRRGCVVDAITRANPAMVLARFDGIAQAGTAATTDIPSSMLPMLVELSTRMKRTHVTSLQFANGADGFVSASPNFPMMRQRVASAIAGSLDPASAQTSPAVPLGTQCGA